jgi:hypothetical protein
MIHAELKIDGCRAELWLNDIPLQLLAPDQSHNVSIPAHLYLLDGINTLEIVVYPGPTPSEARNGPIDVSPVSPKGSATARLAAYNPGDFTGDAKAPVLIEVTWKAAEAEPGPYPRAVRTSRNLGAMFGRWDWEAAERLTLDEATTDEVAYVLETLRTSLAAGDPEPLFRLATLKFRDAATAFPARPLAALAEQFRAVVARDASSANWSFPPLDRQNFDFRLAAEGRLIECVNRDWRPTLRSAPLADSYPKYYAMLLCRLQGRWQIAI